MPTPAETKTLKQFGANLRAERRKVGLSQEALAAAAVLDRTYVGSVERGERNISLLNIAKLAKALSQPASRLIDGLRADTFAGPSSSGKVDDGPELFCRGPRET